jgi:hypothetical protein
MRPGLALVHVRRQIEAVGAAAVGETQAAASLRLRIPAIVSTQIGPS